MTHDWEWLKYVEIPAICDEIGDGLLLFYPHYIYSDWLVVSTPLKNDGLRQLGWKSSRYDGKVISNSMVPNHQPVYYPMGLSFISNGFIPYINPYWIQWVYPTTNQHSHHQWFSADEKPPIKNNYGSNFTGQAQLVRTYHDWGHPQSTKPPNHDVYRKKTKHFSTRVSKQRTYMLYIDV